MLKYLNEKCVTYEPEVFPRIIYHCFNKSKENENNEEKSNIVFLVYASGKIVITGAKKTNLIFETFDEFYPVLRKFKDDVQKI